MFYGGSSVAVSVRCRVLPRRRLSHPAWDLPAMILDKEEHRGILLAVLDQCTFGGALRKTVYEIGEAIAAATVAEQQKPDPSPPVPPGEQH